MLKWLALLGLGGGAYYLLTQKSEEEQAAQDTLDQAALKYQAKKGGTAKDAAIAVHKLACQGAGAAYGVPPNMSGPICSFGSKAFVGGAFLAGKGIGKGGKAIGRGAKKLFKKIF